MSVLMIVVALMIMLLPVSEADAESSASDFRMEGSTLIKYRGTDKNVTIPSTVEVIGRGAFEENKEVELVVLSNSVTRIESYAFWGCDNLDTVVLGRGLSEVGDYAFAKCTGLEQISIPSNVTSIGIQAFGDCGNLQDISIPKETTAIHDSAFDGCTKVTIHCEEGTVAAEYAADFYERQKKMPGYGDNTGEKPDHNENPDTIAGGDNSPDTDQNSDSQTPDQPTMPEVVPGNLIGSTQIVGNQAVLMVNSTQLHVYESGRGESAAGNSTGEIGEGNIPKYRIVDGKTVADQAYYRNRELETLALTEGIEEIGEFAFARSTLTAVVLPDGVRHIGYGAFYHCDALEDVVIPDTVMCVEPKAFSHTQWVKAFQEGESRQKEDAFLISGGVLIAYRGNDTEVTIPEGVRVLSGEVFQNHAEIERVKLPDSLEIIGEGAFEGCSTLGQMDMGAGVKEIKDRAFLGTAMTEVVVPASVEKIGLQAFGSAGIVYQGQEPEITYESSATRLSNSAYRGLSDAETLVSGVTVSGLEILFDSELIQGFQSGQTVLEGADRSYTLNISRPEDLTQMDAAFQRVFGTALPENLSVYELRLTDESGIPLKKLGQQKLSVVLPVPEALKGQQLNVFTLDGNGQLELLPAETVTVGDVEAFRFETAQPSMIGVCGSRVVEEDNEQ